MYRLHLSLARTSVRLVSPARSRLRPVAACPVFAAPCLRRPCLAHAPSRAQFTLRAMASVAAAENAVENNKPILRSDYKPVPYAIKEVDIAFTLGETSTRVATKLTFQGAVSSEPLFLDGNAGLELEAIKLNGKVLTAEKDYVRSSKGLTISAAALGPAAAGSFTVESVVTVHPESNTSLEGLYKSGGNFCTQCEAEGFRKISFFQDRPDVMAIYRVTIDADKAAYPVLLSNGNLVTSRDLPGGRHEAVWHDPWPKPCYLFALVAGQLACRESVFTTRSGRNVALKVLVQPHNLDKTEYAMVSLKAAMKWDEDAFGLEYDLDVFHIVAVDDFNMGAMENKSLNVFNSRLVLASPATATDADYAAIEGVIGHEYFHNYTGNRVTCRNWFQLTLKEGLTVYRDQEFSADLNSRGVKRIADVSRLRAAQFSEDRGPMAHPVRPDSYIKMDNFYSATVYEKGAEVVRVYRSLLGVTGFRKGMDLYFTRHDGTAVTCDDFLAAMADANGVDLSGMRAWYAQAGTPELTVTASHDPAAGTVTLSCAQSTPPTPGQATKGPVLLPIAVGLLGANGDDLPITIQGQAGPPAPTVVCRLDAAAGTFVLQGAGATTPVVSLLRGFSAPVKLDFTQSESDLRFLLSHDSDPFNRYEAGQRLARAMLLRLLAASASGESLHAVAAVAAAPYADGLRGVLADGRADGAFQARCLGLPTEAEVADLVPVADPAAIHAVCAAAQREIAAALKPELTRALAACDAAAVAAGPYVPDTAGKARRALASAALGLLASLGETAVLDDCLSRVRGASNMTDAIGALAALNSRPGPQRGVALAEFEAKWRHEPLVMLKWLGLQAASALPGNVAAVRALTQHAAFDAKNPNKCYALIGGFASGSPVNFHAADGTGYAFLEEMVLSLDKINPQVAARMVAAFTRWRRYDAPRQALMRASLERIAATAGLSANVFEIASKSLEPV